MIPFNYFLTTKNKKDAAIHFFIDDYQFERLWNNPLKYIHTLKKYNYILSPDFSLYLDYPKAYQHFNHWRKHAISAFLQANGIKVIPTLSWSDEESFKWCFDGIEKGSIVAVSSVGSMKDELSKERFIKGFVKAIEVLEPIKIIYFGILPGELNCYQDLLVIKKSYTEKIKERGVI